MRRPTRSESTLPGLPETRNPLRPALLQQYITRYILSLNAQTLDNSVQMAAALQQEQQQQQLQQQKAHAQKAVNHVVLPFVLLVTVFNYISRTNLEYGGWLAALQQTIMGFHVLYAALLHTICSNLLYVHSGL